MDTSIHIDESNSNANANANSNANAYLDLDNSSESSVNSMNITTMITNFENFYEEESIYKTLFICSCDEEVSEVFERLEEHDHSICVLYYDDIYDDHYNYYDKLKDFKTNTHRIFLLSYQTWYIINSELKVYLLPYQDLIVFGSISYEAVKYINNWLYTAQQAGFIDQDIRTLKLCEIE
jgi:hypothetical protein